MNDCRHIFGVVSPLVMPSGAAWPEAALLLPERVACDAQGVDVLVEGAADDDQARLIADAFRIFPKTLLERYVAGRVFFLLPPSQAISSPMGVSVKGGTWFLRGDLVVSSARQKLHQRLWYAIAAQMAEDLAGEPGFDPLRFKAAFARALSTSPGESFVLAGAAGGRPFSKVASVYRIFFKKLAAAEDCEVATLQALFRDANREDRLSLEAAGSQRSLKVGIQQPLNLKKLYREFVDKGFDWPVATGHQLSLALQNSKTRERPESSHRLYLYYSARAVDRFLAGALAKVTPGVVPWVSLTPGFVGSYEPRTPQSGKSAAALAGLLIDAGFPTGRGEWVLHTYIGQPLTVLGEQKSRSPEWEVGVQFRGFDKRLFIGAMTSVSILDPKTSYYGFVLRWED